MLYRGYDKVESYSLLLQICYFVTTMQRTLYKLSQRHAKSNTEAEQKTLVTTSQLAFLLCVVPLNKISVGRGIIK